MMLAGRQLDVLPRSFFLRPPAAVAAALLGCWLVRRGADAGEPDPDRATCAVRIVETEAYLATGDRAAHAAAGRTARTEVLFGAGGRAYVYQSRHHHLLNVSVQRAGIPGCVLLRAGEPMAGLEVMGQRRSQARRGGLGGGARVGPADRPGLKPSQLCSGPAKLAQAMAIDLEFYGMDLCDPMAPLVLAGPPQFETPNQQITTRIGITKDVELPLRFVDAGSDCLSRRLSAPE